MFIVDPTEIYDDAKQIKAQRILLMEIKQNENLTEVETKQNDSCPAMEGKENDNFSVVQTQQDENTPATETKLNEEYPVLETKLDEDISGKETKQNGNSLKEQANKRNTRKICKAKKTAKKRRNSLKKSPGMTGIFTRLVGAHGHKKHQGNKHSIAS